MTPKDRDCASLLDPYLVLVVLLLNLVLAIFSEHLAEPTTCEVSECSTQVSNRVNVLLTVPLALDLSSEQDWIQLVARGETQLRQKQQYLSKKSMKTEDTKGRL